MSEKAFKIIEKWKRYIPPTVPKGDVETVVEYFFPNSYRYHQKTSHWLIIADEDLRRAGQAGYDTGTTEGHLSLSLVSGKEVKQYLVQNLLSAIKIKQLMVEEKKNR